MIYRGYFQNYGGKQHSLKRLLKDIKCATLLARARRAHPGGAIRILAYPCYPSKSASISGIADELGLYVSNKPHAEARLAIYWAFEPASAPDPDLLAFARDSGRRVINLHALDVEKSTLARGMEAGFGYSAAIDPLRYRGPVVEKSEKNAEHDGRVREGPLREADIQPEKNYSRLIDNTVPGGEVRDIRVPIFDNEIPAVLFKYRRTDERFQRKMTRVEMAETGEAFSLAEQESLLRFCRELGIAHAELDVLRDNADGRLYVVDANPTPFSPPRLAPRAIKRAFRKRTAAAFARNFLPELLD